MKLRELLAGTEVAEIAGDAETEIGGLAYDSRRVEPGTLFFCVPGQRSDGHDFGARAVERGAAALVVERPLDLPVPQVRVARRPRGDGPARGSLLGRSHRQLRVAGVTGTNGKTTTAFLIRHLLEAHGTRTGLLGTVKRSSAESRSRSSAPPPRRSTCSGRSAACSRRATPPARWRSPPMPWRSERTAGVRFAVAVFTNLTQDHLDFHADMEDYFVAKRACSVLADAPTGEARAGRRWSTSTTPMGPGLRPS